MAKQNTQNSKHKVTYSLDLMGPDEHNPQAAALLKVTVGRMQSRSYRKATGKDYVYTEHLLALTPEGLHNFRMQAERLELDWSLRKQVWVIQMTKGYARMGLKKGDVILMPAGPNTEPLKLSKTKRNSTTPVKFDTSKRLSKNAPANAGYQVTNRPTTQKDFDDISDRWEAFTADQFAPYYPSLSEDLKIQWANRWLTANGQPIPGLEPKPKGPHPVQDKPTDPVLELAQAVLVEYMSQPGKAGGHVKLDHVDSTGDEDPHHTLKATYTAKGGKPEPLVLKFRQSEKAHLLQLP